MTIKIVFHLCVLVIFTEWLVEILIDTKLADVGYTPDSINFQHITEHMNPSYHIFRLEIKHANPCRVLVRFQENNDHINISPEYYDIQSVPYICCVNIFIS